MSHSRDRTPVRAHTASELMGGRVCWSLVGRLPELPIVRADVIHDRAGKSPRIHVAIQAVSNIGVPFSIGRSQQQAVGIRSRTDAHATSYDVVDHGSGTKVIEFPCQAVVRLRVVHYKMPPSLK